MNLINVICEMTMRAAAKIIIDKGLNIDDFEIINEAMKKVVKAGYSKLNSDLQEAYQVHMGEMMYQEILKAGCVKFAIDSLKQAGYKF